MTTRAGFAAIIGAPNAGKSTLTNRLVGAKVTIVTQKVQTTRFPVRGVAMAGESQIVLVDTPGIFSPRRRLDRAMVRSAWGGADEADVTVHLVDVQAELAAEEQTADLPARLLAAEITREKLFLRVHEELPYAAAVETTAFQERKDGSVRIEQSIYVERESQRPIVLGKNGQTLKWIGQKSREELIELFDRPVHLFLHVKVDERWADKREFYGDVGLDFDA